MPPVADENKFTVCVRHIGPLFVGAAVGTGFTLTVTVAVFTQPFTSVPVTV